MADERVRSCVDQIMGLARTGTLKRKDVLRVIGELVTGIPQTGLAPLLTTPQVAEIMGVSRQAVWQMVKSGLLTAININQPDRVPEYRFPPAAVQRIVRDRKRRGRA